MFNKIKSTYTTLRGGKMEKNYMKQGEQESQHKFNSITQKGKPENQNQTHNVRKEGIGPQNQLK